MSLSIRNVNESKEDTSGLTNPVVKLEPPLPAMALEFSQAAREGRVLGIGLCGFQPSGCYDIANHISSQFPNVPYVRAEYTNQLFWVVFNFLDQPKPNATCDTVFFTGCGLTAHGMLPLINSLVQTYKFTNIKYVYHIVPPHLAFEEKIQNFQKALDQGKHIFSHHNSPYQFRLLHSGVDTRFEFNIGMPPFKLTSSTFDVPVDCYGLIRHRFIEDFLPSNGRNKCLPRAEKYLREYFRQVADAGKKNNSASIMVIALGFESNNRWENQARQLFLDIANEYSIKIDFCDNFPNNRLPQQQDFFKVLQTMKEKGGIFSIDSAGTQSLLQALSFGATVMIYSDTRSANGDFYQQLVNLVPAVHQPTAQVILGRSTNYDLFKDSHACQAVYQFLCSEIKKANQRFEVFKSAAEGNGLSSRGRETLGSADPSSINVGLPPPVQNTGLAMTDSAETAASTSTDVIAISIPTHNAGLKEPLLATGSETSVARPTESYAKRLIQLCVNHPKLTLLILTSLALVGAAISTFVPGAQFLPFLIGFSAVKIFASMFGIYSGALSIPLVCASIYKCCCMSDDAEADKYPSSLANTNTKAITNGTSTTSIARTVKMERQAEFKPIPSLAATNRDPAPVHRIPANAAVTVSTSEPVRQLAAGSRR